MVVLDASLADGLGKRIGDGWIRELRQIERLSKAPITVIGDAPPPEEAPAEEAEPVLPALAQKKVLTAAKGKAAKVKQKSGPKSYTGEQAVLPFVEKSAASLKSKPGIGKRHGKKKTKN